MKEPLLMLFSLCMIAALCEQLLQGKRYAQSVRLLLGVQIAAVFVDGIYRLCLLLNVWQ